MASLAPILQRFFTDRMITQRHAREHTIGAYRDAFRLLLSYAQQATGTPPWKLELRQLDAALITGFLQHLRHQRRNSGGRRDGGGHRYLPVRLRPGRLLGQPRPQQGNLTIPP